MTFQTYNKYRLFKPDYNHLISAARNVEAERVPLYDHNVDIPFLSTIIGTDMDLLFRSEKTESLREFFRCYCKFFYDFGYDTVSFEICIGPCMPGSGSLGGHKPGIIQNREDYDRYPWDTLQDLYFNHARKYYDLLRESLPEGMKAVGGPGNGVFECVQDITGFENLCLISCDDPELYRQLFEKVGEMSYCIWKQFMVEFSDMYAVFRFGDDLGYKSSTLIKPDDVRKLVIPQYRKVINLVHSYKKPFLLHSCGNIFEVMPDLIEAGIDAKHSNEDAIAPFDKWVGCYGQQIGNFGGIDMDILCHCSAEDIRVYTLKVIEQSRGNGGIAIGSGNSIPHYVPVEGYRAMNSAVREFRGDL